MKRNFKRLKYFLKDPDKKPFSIMVKEVIELWVLKREFPLHYFGRFFYRNNAPDFRKFMSLKEFNLIAKNVAERNETSVTKDILQNKLFFSFYCEKYNIPNPKLISYNFNNQFYSEGNRELINTEEDILRYFKTIFKKHTIEKLFLKIFDGSSGIGAVLLTKEKLNTDYKTLWKTLKSNNYIHQEVIEQHPKINEIYSKSINSLRIETYIDNEKKLHFLGHHMRFGSGNSYLDNINQGGFYVDINFESGTLNKNGKTNMIFGAKIIKKHPDTGFVFEGFKIPFFKESLFIIKDIVNYIPGYIQAWDIAITPNGPIFIEGNNYPSLITAEWSYGGFKNKPIFKEILDNCK